MADTVDGFTTINVDNRGQTGQTITHMFDRHGPFKNAACNAKLIAAAPGMADALRETQEDLSDARTLADRILNDRHHSVTGTEAERIAYLLRYLERGSRVARTALVKAGVL